MLLSIIIPSYNHAQFVLTTIRAAAAIDVREKEIIVIDDGSSDDSAKLIQEYIAASGVNSSIRLIARENRGLVKTLNQGLSISQGKYFYIVASDDIPISKGIARLVSILEADPKLQFALGNALSMESEQQHVFHTTYGEAHTRFFSLPDNLRCKELFLNYPQPILLQSTVFRAATLKNIDGWREDIILDDMSMFTRMLSRASAMGKDFEFRPEIMTCFYRRHPANISRNECRQFQTIEQLLVLLCPPELKSAALLRNFVSYAIPSVKGRRILQAMRFFRSTIRHLGLIRFMRAAASEFRGILADRSVRRHASKREMTVLHEPPDKLMGRM